MDLLNETKMQAGYTIGMQPDGRELLVVVVKGTFTIPKNGEEPKLAEEHVPLVTSDVFTDEPGFSAPLYEIDFAPRKPRCDVLLNGSAYAPSGKPVKRVTVSLCVGPIVKSFTVVGNRVWQPGWLRLTTSKPEPFTVMPISYNNAFGGVERTEHDPPKEHWYPLNHAGVGCYKRLSGKDLYGRKLPNTEELGRPITTPYGRYRPMAFGSVGRSWQPRVRWAGTYDDNWVDNVRPFFPSDFDERYYQAAPEDQQTDHLQGGEKVELKNLTPVGREQFCLPRSAQSIMFYLRGGEEKKKVPVLDTVILEPDQRRLLMVWRSSLSLPRNIFDVRQIKIVQST